MTHHPIKQHCLWLSHVLAVDTPAYADGTSLQRTAVNQMSQGDSCNTEYLAFANHLGSHVDAPRHFVANGKTVTDYEPKDWIFTHPLLLDIPTEPGELVTPQHLSQVGSLAHVDLAHVNLVLLRTGIERYRGQQAFWQNGPGLAPELADALLSHFPNLQAVGLDAISISSLNHRSVGRVAHHAFLSRGIRLFEDLALSRIKNPANLAQVWAAPLRFCDADGAPCTVLGWENLS